MTQKNYVDSSGITVQDYASILTDLIASFQAIYGTDINVNSNSPDGQMIGIFAQAKSDLLETIVQVYNSFSPERATGRSLDQRVAYNGIIRQAATYTRVPITVTTDRVLTLLGLDTSASPFTVSDLSGNSFQLETTTTTAIGANILTFQSAVAGATQTTIGTITTISTITLGVLSVNNPSSNTQDGVDEETDVQLRMRRQAAVSIPSVGFIDGLTGLLKSTDGVTDAIVFENTTNTTDSYGIPGHSIWAVVDGGTDADVAQAIYTKRNAGCGMLGNEYVDIVQTDTHKARIHFDRPLDNKLYIKMTLGSIDSTHTPDTTYIAAQLLATLDYGIYDTADFTAITTLVKELDPRAVVMVGGVAGPYYYNATTDYVVGNLVSYGTGNAVYKCILNSTDNLPTNETYWEAHSLVIGDFVQYLPPATVQGKWVLEASRITVT